MAFDASNDGCPIFAVCAVARLFHARTKFSNGAGEKNGEKEGHS